MRRHAFLFEQLVRRELRQKYAGSALGVLWYVANPLVLMGAYTLIFGVVIPQHVPDYPIFLMVGILVWTFFSQSLLNASLSLVEQASLIRKARFPRETIPAATVSVQLVTFIAVLVLLLPVALAVHGHASAWLLLLPLLVAALFGFVLGAALLFAALHAHFRDVWPILSAALLPWFFVTPIFFSSAQFPAVARHPWARILLEWVNPIAPFIEALRRVIYDGAGPGWGRGLYIGLAAAVMLVAGRAVFRRLAPELAVVL